MIETPFDKIKKSLSINIPLDLVERLPDKWEKIGNVVKIALSNEFDNIKHIIGKVYAEQLDCKTVLNNLGGITGIYRKPNVEIIYGTSDTETVHKENGIRYKLDPQKIMFSPGNMDERIRMANVSKKDETVVDIFAGIGYFTLPIAVHSQPKKVIACEINPVSYNYLCENIVLNNVTSIVEPLMGDSKNIAPRNVADRVVMGHIGGTHRFLSTAFECLKNHTGIIHFHDTFSEDKFPNEPFEIVKIEASKYDLNVKFLKYKYVKSYAPGVDHFVFDFRIDEK
jgi:tRNA wybutosine-synthesizing protein 2